MRSRFADIWGRVAVSIVAIVEADDGAEHQQPGDDDPGMHFTVAVDADSDDDGLHNLNDSDED